MLAAAVMSLYYARLAAIHTLQRLSRKRTFPRRYDQLLHEVDLLRPRHILEVGTNDGLNAVRLCKRAARHRTDVIYYGFDLFEGQTEESYLREFALRVPSLKSVRNYLKRQSVDFHLFPGDTRDTLAAAELPQVDLAFIDGGHSEETVAADWKNLQRLVHEKSVIYFDDYPNWGVGPVVDSIDRSIWNVEIMPVFDEFPAAEEFGGKGGSMRRFQFARVTRR